MDIFYRSLLFPSPEPAHDEFEANEEIPTAIPSPPWGNRWFHKDFLVGGGVSGAKANSACLLILSKVFLQ